MALGNILSHLEIVLCTFSSCVAVCIARRYVWIYKYVCGPLTLLQEIPYLSYPIDDVRTYSQLVRNRLGWKQSEPNLGWVDLKSPEYLLE